MKRSTVSLTVTAILAAGFAGQAAGQAKEQYVPHNYYWVGPFAPGGTGIAGGAIGPTQ